MYSPWTGNNTQCFLSQFNNAMYVLGADSSDFSVCPSTLLPPVIFHPTNVLCLTLTLIIPILKSIILSRKILTPQKIYVFSYSSKTWSTQSTSSAPTAQLTRSASVLDHDTNVIFTFTDGGLTQLDLSSITDKASGGALGWEGVSAPSWGGGYSGSATAGQASNHISELRLPQ